jgi:hypothetical protein
MLSTVATSIMQQQAAITLLTLNSRVPSQLYRAPGWDGAVCSSTRSLTDPTAPHQKEAQRVNSMRKRTGLTVCAASEAPCFTHLPIGHRSEPLLIAVTCALRIACWDEKQQVSSVSEITH